MKKNKLLLYTMILIAIILCIPSIRYLLNYHTVNGFNSYYTYTLEKSNHPTMRMISGCIVIGLVLLFSVIYLRIVQKEKEIFKNKKQVFGFIILISVIFMIILPYLSSDIYYYIGDSWLASNYHENPYYTTVKDLQNKGINDEILSNTGYWGNTTSVYGPIWNGLAILLVSLSFGKVTVALYIFKIANLLVHILNCYLIYKITKSTKKVLLYGLNPLVLIELLSNVHNDIYLILSILLALYFLLEKKNIYLTILALGISVAIKYSTVLLIPFLLLYYFKDKSIAKRLGYCIITGIAIIGITIILYLPFYRDISIFTNMLAQGSRYSQSIMLLLMKIIPQPTFRIINLLRIPLFLIIYSICLIRILLTNNIKKDILFKNYNILMIIFIFFILTNFQKWYILWLLPTMFYAGKQQKIIILFLTISAIIPSWQYFKIESDSYLAGIGYAFLVLLITMILFNGYELINTIKKEKMVK